MVKYRWTFDILLKKVDKNCSRKQTKCDLQDVKNFIYLFNSFSIACIRCIRSEAHIPPKREKKSEIAAAATRTTLHISRCAYVEITEPMDVSKPAECRNYSLRCTLCSGFSVHPFSFLTLRRCRPFARTHTHIHTLSRSLRLFGSISLDSLDLLYLAYPAATIPHLYALIPVHTDSGYLRESIPRATFTLHNASDLCFFLRAASVTLFTWVVPKGHSFSHKAFLIYKIRQEQRKHI